MKEYIKKNKLKGWVKELLLVSLIISMIFGSLVAFKVRNDMIDSGELELVYQYGGDI